MLITNRDPAELHALQNPGHTVIVIAKRIRKMNYSAMTATLRFNCQDCDWSDSEVLYGSVGSQQLEE